MSSYKLSEDVNSSVGQKNSFDVRIYDDLCEDILQWLTFDDRNLLAGVSKQFQRCLQSLNSKQTVVYVDSELDNNLFNQKNILKEVIIGSDFLFTVDVKGLAKLLKQFPNIRKIFFGKFTKIWNTNQVLATIIDNCGQLETIRFDFKYSDLQLLRSFGLKFAQNLKELEFIDSYGITTTVEMYVLWNCPHLKSISNVNFMSLLGFNGILAKNLIKAEELYNIQSQPLFEMFVDQNLTLKHLEMDLELETTEEISSALLKLSQLKDLELLSIDLLNFQSFDKQIVESFETIGQKCKNLKCLTITALDRHSNSKPIKPFNTENCFKVMKTFLNLKKLSLFSIHNQNVNLDSKCLKSCHQLIDLDLTSDQINDQFFDSFETIVPKLKSLRVSIKNDLTDRALEEMAKLKYLKILMIRRFTGEDFPLITDSGVQSVINRCNHLRKFQIIYKTSITGKTIRALIEKAIERPKIMFEYEFYRLISEPTIEDIIENVVHSLNNINIKGD